MSKENKIAVFWHRRDLRIEDNAGLYHALKSGYKVLPIFILDSTILNSLEDKTDARVEFIVQQLEKLNAVYAKSGSGIKIYHDKPLEAWKKIISEYNVGVVFTNRDYEPYAQQRDKEIYSLLQKKEIEFKGFKDQVIFEKSEIIKNDHTPYTVFTPYSRKWKETLNTFYLKSYPTEKYLKNLFSHKTSSIPSLKEIGFQPSKLNFPSSEFPLGIIRKYEQTRDIPSVAGTSRLSLHLRFGTISIRKLATVALKQNEKYLNELIWRDFYQMILFHFPHTVHKSFKPAYDKIKWRNNEKEFQAWCSGETGYPIVDAGIRELNSTGYMHNRVRMIVASFLTKHLLIDWRWGEAYFAKKLLDFELASNIGGWQWAAGCGCDAAPYFRVFNPTLQQQKFDPEFKYIKKWVPEFGTTKYVKPIVEHEFARKRILEVFKRALSSEM